MGPAGYFLTLAALLSGPATRPAGPGSSSPDTTTYANRATSDLVARAMARHQQQDSSVRDYRARVRYRLSFGFGKRKWAAVPPVAVEEQEGTVAWQLPNNLRVDMLGRRQATQVEGMDLSSQFSRPWFVPRTLGDSIRVFGSDDDRAAPHPLAAGAEQHYHYAAGDSLTITVGGRRTTLRSVTVTPKGIAPTLVAGRLWLDTSTGDVVRFTFRFVGTALWVEPDAPTRGDSASARRANQLISRILQLDLDLEYGLQDNQHWMPYRQVISGRVSIPFGVDVTVPFSTITTFDDYSINAGTVVAFSAPPPPPRDSTAPTPNDGSVRVSSRRDDRDRRSTDRVIADSVRNRGRTRDGTLPQGGRFEIHYPPPDSLRMYQGWGDTLVFDVSEFDRKRFRQATDDLAHLAETLPAEMTGRPTAGLALERLGDYLRYNRAQGTTLSLGGRAPSPWAFTDLYGAVRYGVADKRFMARLSAVRDAPAGRWTIALQRDLVDVDPFARGLTLGNSLRGAFAGHDDGAYLLAEGGRVNYETSLGLGTEINVGARVEQQRPVFASARATIPRVFGATGFFTANPPSREGLAVGGGARIDHTGRSVRWMLDADGGAVAGDVGARLVGELRLPTLFGGWLTARLKGGAAVGTTLVPQFALHAGGLQTVRGYDYGVSHGNGLWALQLDLGRPRSNGVVPVFFADVGQAGVFSRWGDAPFLSGVGVGYSLLRGFMRVELSHPLTHRESRGLRFDLVFGGVR